MRPPIITVLGHVDCGKTTFLDIFRKMTLKNREPGGITQSISIVNLKKESIDLITKGSKEKIEIPGILFIDTPGHECFSDQRLTGLEVSDIVIVIIDIFKGLEKTTLQCIEQLISLKKPFIVLANKIDKILGWKCKKKMSPFILSYKNQEQDAKQIFDNLIKDLNLKFAENGLNSKLYYENPNYNEYYSIVPISANTGQGLPDVLAFIDKMAKHFLKNKLKSKQEILSGFIIENKDDEKLGNVYSIVVTDGSLNNNDKILGLSIKGEKHYYQIKSIFSKNDDIYEKINLTDSSNHYLIKVDDTLPKLMSGIRFFGKFKENDDEKFKSILDKKLDEMKNKLDSYQYQEFGVLVVGSSFGTINALLNLCNIENIPVNSICIGTPKKKDIIRCISTMEKYKIVYPDDEIYRKRFGIVLNFGVRLGNKIKKYCEDKVTIIEDEIIYNLIKKYNQFKDNLDKVIKEKNPNISTEYQLFILDQYIFTKKNPIIIGVKVVKNCLYKDSIVNANLYKNEILEKTLNLGKITNIQKNKKELDKANLNEEICIKIIPLNDQKKYEYGKDFDSKWILEPYFSEEDKEKMKKYKIKN